MTRQSSNPRGGCKIIPVKLTLLKNEVALQVGHKGLDFLQRTGNCDSFRGAGTSQLEGPQIARQVFARHSHLALVSSKRERAETSDEGVEGRRLPHASTDEKGRRKQHAFLFAASPAGKRVTRCQTSAQGLDQAGLVQQNRVVRQVIQQRKRVRLRRRRAEACNFSAQQVEQRFPAAEIRVGKDQVDVAELDQSSQRLIVAL